MFLRNSQSAFPCGQISSVFFGSLSELIKFARQGGTLTSGNSTPGVRNVNEFCSRVAGVFLFVDLSESLDVARKQKKASNKYSTGKFSC